MRKIVRLMKNWQFIGPEGNTTAVDLPHTWNAIDGLPHPFCGSGL